MEVNHIIYSNSNKRILENSFKFMSNLWLDYMISFLEFRESLRQWFELLNFVWFYILNFYRLYIAEEELIEEVGKLNYNKITQNLKALKTKIENENKKLYDHLRYNTPLTHYFTLQELNNEISNNGLLVILLILKYFLSFKWKVAFYVKNFFFTMHFFFFLLLLVF